jgi:hypothetical protein
MGYIPESAKWYLADIVEQITVEDDPRNVVHTNMVLVRADSPEEAYEKAMELGKAGEMAYENPVGKRVSKTFRGLRDLNVIHDKLKHGAELIYSESIDMDEDDIQCWVSPKEELGVFAPRTPSSGPDYRAKDIVEGMIERMEGRKPI